MKQAGETTHPTWARQRRASKEPQRGLCKEMVDPCSSRPTRASEGQGPCSATSCMDRVTSRRGSPLFVVRGESPRRPRDSFRNPETLAGSEVPPSPLVGFGWGRRPAGVLLSRGGPAVLLTPSGRRDSSERSTAHRRGGLGRDCMIVRPRRTSINKMCGQATGLVEIRTAVDVVEIRRRAPPHRNQNLGKTNRNLPFKHKTLNL